MSNYLKVNTSHSQLHSFLSTVIRNPRPFLLSRFGDGEVWLLNGAPNDPSPGSFDANLGFRKMREAGLIYNSAAELNPIIATIKKELEDSLRAADVIGILDPDGENGVDLKKIAYSPKKWSIPLNLLEKLRPSHDTLICDHLAFRTPLFGNPHAQTLLRGTPLHIISPNSQRLQKANLSKILKCDISYTTLKYKNLREQNREPMPEANELFYNKEEIIKKLNLIKEDIVLFGAGTIGKYIGSYLKSAGKVALDYGSTLDAWSGLYTRPWFRSSQRHCII